MKFDFAGLNARLLARSEAHLSAWFPEGRKEGKEFKVGSLNGERGDSLSVNVNTGVWKDFATGETGSDLISLYAASRGLGQYEAAKDIDGIAEPLESGIDVAAIKANAERRKTASLSIIPAAILASSSFAAYPVGSPSGKWVYPDASGNPILVVARYETAEGKQFRPWFFDGWALVCKSPDVRPLYRLDLLAANPSAPVLVTEGEKACDALQKIVGDKYVCVTWPGGANAPSKADWSPLTGRSVTLWPDADEAGRKAMNEVATYLSGGRVTILDVSGFPEKYDAADALADGMNSEDFERFANSKAIHSNRVESKPIFCDVADLVSDIKPISWAIRGFVERESLALVYGPPGCGKSFLVIDWAASIASGRPWFGHKIASDGPVFYIAGEGHNGIARRFKAWEVARDSDIKHGSIYKSFTAVPMLDEESIRDAALDIEKTCTAIGKNPSAIVIDTLARNFGGGDENSTEDMGRFIENMDKYFKQRFGCLVLIVHHSGHTEGRARGSSSLKAAVDAEYEVAKDEAGLVTLTATKMKDADLPEPMTFKLQSVELPELFDDEGEPVTSAIMTIDEDQMSAVVHKTKLGVNITAKDALITLYKGWLPFGQLGEAFGITKASAQKMVAKLVDMKLLVKDGVGYALTDAAVCELSYTGALLGTSKTVAKDGDSGEKQSSKKVAPWLQKT